LDDDEFSFSTVKIRTIMNKQKYFHSFNGQEFTKKLFIYTLNSTVPEYVSFSHSVFFQTNAVGSKLIDKKQRTKGVDIC